MRNEVKIIAGLYRGRRITFPNLPEIRPTPARVKETLFNWLAPFMNGAHCLDVFAGSGALGFEAISRGAEEVVMIESHENIVSHLKKFKTTLQCKGLRIVHADALCYLQQLTAAFDIVFLDPPFNNPQYGRLIHIIQSQQLLKPDGLLYLESSCAISLDQNYWECQKQKKAGEVFYSLWSYKTP